MIIFLKWNINNIKFPPDSPGPNIKKTSVSQSPLDFSTQTKVFVGSDFLAGAISAPIPLLICWTSFDFLAELLTNFAFENHGASQRIRIRSRDRNGEADPGAPKRMNDMNTDMHVALFSPTVCAS